MIISSTLLTKLTVARIW